MTALAVNAPASAGFSLAPIVPLPPPTQFEAYARAVQQQPFLTEAEEADLMAKWREQGDRDAAWRLVVSHLRLVVRSVRDHAGYGLSQGDLAQEGTVGLMKAVRRFDPIHGVRLAAYAIQWVDAEIREFIFKNWRMVRLTGTTAARKLFFGYRKTVAALRGWGETREPLGTQAIAQALGVADSDVRAMEGFFRGQDEGLELPLYAEGGTSDVAERALSVAVGWHQEEDPSLQWEVEDTTRAAHRVVHAALAQLPERDRVILQARRLTSPPVGLQELGDRLGISAERVRQIDARAWKKLSETLQGQEELVA